jgi:glycosyltransferase 2 family protein
VIQRVMKSRSARWFFVIVAVALALIALAKYGEQVRAAAVDLHPLNVVGAAALVLVGTGFMVLSWRRVLTDLGSQLPVRAAARVFSLAQLGKYIPGSVWPFVAQVELGREHGVPRARSAAVSVVSVVISLVTSLLVASIALPFSAEEAARAYWWALAATPFCIAALHPRVLNPGLDRLLRLARRPPLEHRLTVRGVAVSVAWNLAGWTAYGLHIWLLAIDLGGSGWSLPLASTGAFALAWSAGFVFVIAPAGAGIREIVLAAGLGPLLGVGRVVLLVIASRLLMTIGDLIWATGGYLLGRRHALANDELEEALALQRAGAEPTDP